MCSTTSGSWHSASNCCCSRKCSSSSPSPPLLFCQTQSGWDSGPAPRTSWTRPSQCCTPARIRDSEENFCLKGLISYRTWLAPSSRSSVTHVERFSSPHIPNPNSPMPWGASYQAVHLGKFQVNSSLEKTSGGGLIYLVSGEAIYRLVIFLFPWSHSSTTPNIKIMIIWSS